jgi:hypothetical protein
MHGRHSSRHGEFMGCSPILLLENVVLVQHPLGSPATLPLPIWCRFCEATRRALHTTEVIDPMFHAPGRRCSAAIRCNALAPQS